METLPLLKDAQIDDGQHEEYRFLVELIHQVTNLASRGKNNEDIYKEALNSVLQISGAIGAALLLQQEGQEAKLSLWENSLLLSNHRRVLQNHLELFSTNKSTKTALISNINDASTNTELQHALQAENIGAIANVPLISQNIFSGLLVIIYSAPHEFSTLEIQLLEIIASQIALTIDREKAEQSLSEVNAQLTEWVQRLEERNRAISLVNTMSDLLQTCLTLEEAYSIVAKFAQELFPEECGALYILDSERGILEAETLWGEPPIKNLVFTPDGCWALRRGRVYAVQGKSRGLICQHVSKTSAANYLCVPLLIQGEVLGLLHLETSSNSSDDSGLFANEENPKQRLAITLADQAALAMANIRLRETLRSQAIRDALTGLFNRRYMEETLKREIHRVARRGTSLGIIMLDLDHFKVFNDTLGHQAGDALLHEIGLFLQTRTRGEDIVCRYGGEEFTVILPETPQSVVVERAEELREGIKMLQVEHYQHHVGPITLSAGVALFPDHGLTSDALLRAADSALYQAKAAGRDRVVMAGTTRRETLLQPTDTSY